MGKTVYLLAALALALGLLWGSFRVREETARQAAAVPEPTVVSRTICREGEEYYPRQDITVILALGTDRRGTVRASRSHRNEVQADALVLLILDHGQQTCQPVCLDRDLAAELPEGGRDSLAMAHTWGEGLADSCEHTRQAVSELFHGITIDHYLSVSMDGLGLLNDAAGGVTVPVPPGIGPEGGMVTLSADQALAYLQTRQADTPEDIGSRVSRHGTYVRGLLTAMKARAAQEPGFLPSLYRELGDYLVTDCTVNGASALLEQCLDYTLLEPMVLEDGESVAEETTLSLFYEPKG